MKHDLDPFLKAIQHRAWPRLLPRRAMNLSRQEQIWNRACLESGGPAPAHGDQALASLLLAHGLAMNGGVVHAIECLSQPELEAAVAGFNYFELPEAVSVFQHSLDDSEEIEEQLDRQYRAAVPNDETLSHAFRMKLIASPDAFGPTNP